MSAALLDGRMGGWRHGHVGSWATSLVLHGLLGGVIVWFIAPTAPPEIEAPFRWDVALVSAPVSAASAPAKAIDDHTTPASAAKSSPAQAAPRATPSAAAVPVAAPLSAPPASTVTSEPVAQPPDAVIASAPGAEKVLAPPSIVAPVVASAPLNPPASAVNTGELADQLWRRMEALKRYPYLARRNGWEGKVFIKVVLGGDGRLLHAEIQESSGHEVLDQDALRVLRAAAALKVDSNTSWQQQATFTLPVAYRLQR
jgi:protein TonB